MNGKIVHLEHADRDVLIKPLSMKERATLMRGIMAKEEHELKRSFELKMMGDRNFKQKIARILLLKCSIRIKGGATGANNEEMMADAIPAQLLKELAATELTEKERKEVNTSVFLAILPLVAMAGAVDPQSGKLLYQSHSDVLNAKIGDVELICSEVLSMSGLTAPIS